MDRIARFMGTDNLNYLVSLSYFLPIKDGDDIQSL